MRQIVSEDEIVEIDVVILELDRLQPGIAPRELLFLLQGSEQK